MREPFVEPLPENNKKKNAIIVLALLLVLAATAGVIIFCTARFGDTDAEQTEIVGGDDNTAVNAGDEDTAFSYDGSDESDADEGYDIYEEPTEQPAADASEADNAVEITHAVGGSSDTREQPAAENSANSAPAQNVSDESADKPAPKIVDDDKIYDIVEEMPKFPGGDAALLKHISEHLRYPAVSMEAGVQGRVVVRFVVTRSGDVDDIRIVRSLDEHCDREAKRVISTLPKFTPAKHNGTPVAVWYNLPVTFRLQ